MRARKRRFPVWVRLVLVALFAIWAFGLTALERRRMESSALHPSSRPSPPLMDPAVPLADVQALSAPDMEGRRTGSGGNHRAQAFIADRFKTIGLQPVNGSYEQKFSFTHHSIRGLLLPGRAYETGYPDATNLFGALRGSSSPDSWLILSAHYDHLGVRDGELYPGADDNASGIATLLAAAAHFAAHPPRHSMLFIAFDAEEQGLKGSQHFVEHPPIDLARVALMVNVDMVSRGDDGVIVASGTRDDDRLRALVTRAAADRNLSVQFGHDRPMYVAGRVEPWTHSSDHGPFASAGVRTLYYGVEDHADYHRPGDVAARIPQPFFAEAVSLVINTLREADLQ